MTLSVRSPHDARKEFDRLNAFREQTKTDLSSITSELEKVRRFLEISGKVTSALEVLSEKLFSELLRLIEREMSVALQEVLEQPIEFKAEVTWKNNAAAVDFFIEREGNREDILKGQGGSVANIVSAGLRMFALTTLAEDEHRRFLVLDEQDCWLRPDLVPRMIRIIDGVAKQLGFQVLLISHHDSQAFESYADRIYRLRQSPNGVQVDLTLDRTD